MGIAALGVVLCHAMPYGVNLGHLSILFSHGAFGVDLFLLLSGFGIYFSLQKYNHYSVLAWYTKRIKRIIFPYIITITPFLIIYVLLFKKTIIDFLECISFISYFKNHFGLWFLPCILLLYLFSPIYKALFDTSSKIKGKVLITLCTVLVFCFLGSYHLIVDENSVLYNTQVLLGRSASFFIGWGTGYLAKLNTKISVYKLLIGIVIIHFLFYFILPKGFSWWWIYTIPVTFILCYLIRFFLRFKHLNNFLLFLGSISLESYITNWGLTLVFPPLLTWLGVSVYINKTIQYSIVVLLGILLAGLANKCVAKINKI